MAEDAETYGAAASALTFTCPFLPCSTQVQNVVPQQLQRLGHQVQLDQVRRLLRLRVACPRGTVPRWQSMTERPAVQL